MFGLQSDLPYVLAVARSGTSSADFGVELTMAEVADLKARQALESEVAVLQEQLANWPSFGGLFIDQRAGGIVDVALAGDPAGQTAKIASIADARLRLRVRRVEYTLAALEAARAAVEADRTYHKDLGTWVHELATDVTANRVHVGIHPYSEAIASALSDRYGSAVAVSPAIPQSPTVCVSRDNCAGPPLRAGIRLWDAGCTSAFIARLGADRVMLTAGHCANLVPAGHIYQHPNNANIGSMGAEVYYNNSNADAGWVQMDDALASNLIYRDPGTAMPVWYIQGVAEEVIGMTVCISGRVSGYNCGTLFAKDFSITYSDGTTLVSQRSATYALASGDSGAPVFAFNRAFGIQSGINTAGRGIYSHISHVQAQLGVVTLTS